MKKKYSIILFFLFFVIQIFAQEYLTSVKHYNLEKGLETRNIQGAIKDSQGFMWFISRLGAYRFDGNEFKVFRWNQPNTSQTYAIKELVEDKKRNIWFLHETRGVENPEISVLPFGSETLINFQDFIKSDLPFEPNDIIETRTYEPHGIVVLTKDGKLYEYQNENFELFFNLNSVDKGEREITPFFSCDKDAAGNRWLVYRHDVFKITPENLVSKVDELPKNKANEIFIDSNNKIWFISDGLNLFSKKDENTPLKKQSFPTLKKELKDNRIYIKKEHLIWANRLNPLDFQLIIPSKNISINFKEFIEQKGISLYDFFVENDNSIWVLSHEGIYHIRFVKNRFKTILKGRGSRGILKNKAGNLVISSDVLKEYDPDNYSIVKPIRKILALELFESDAGDLWFGSYGPQVFKVNQDENSKKIYPLDKNIQAVVNLVYQDQQTKQIWAGTSAGLFKFSAQKKVFEEFQNFNDYTDFQKAHIRFISEVDGTLLIATEKGIFELDPKKGIINHYSTKDNTFPTDQIVFIHKDKTAAQFWIGTKYGGLIRWDKTTGITKQFTKDNGFSDNLIYAVYEDDFGFLWLPSNVGLMCFNKKTHQVTIFNEQDGIAHDEFNFYSHFQDENGTLYFGGINGITIFHPKDFNKKNNSIPEAFPFYLTDIEVLDKKSGLMVSVLKELHTQKKIILPPENSGFRASFALLDFKNPEAINYYYKIDGLEDEWTTVESNNFRINSLDHGEYNVLIKAVNNNSQPAYQLNVSIQVLTPFYLKWWFLILAVLTLWGLIRLFINWRTNNLAKRNLELEQAIANRTAKIQNDKTIIEKQADELKQIDEIKSRFFANVTHELRTPLTLILGPLQQLMKTNKFDEKTLKSLEIISQNGEKLKQLVEEILDLSRYDANQLEMKKSPTHFLKQIREWATSFHFEAQHRGIDFQLYYQLPVDLYLNIDTKKMEKIVTNLLSNAFKFSQNGDAITLMVTEKKKKIHLKVIDTGVGIHQDDLPFIFDRFFQSKKTDTQLQGGLGIGLALSKELVGLMNGELSVTSEVNKGTTFTLIFPKEAISNSTIPPFIDLEPVNENQLTPIAESKNKINIIVAEDNLQLQAFIQELLVPFANTFIANNGKEVLEMLKNGNKEFQLIISDVMMPEMDGFTMLEQLKLKKEWQLIPVIMLTARGDISDKLKALTIGVDDYLVKPFEPQELIARIKTIIQNIELRQRQPIAGNNFEWQGTMEEIESVDIKWLKELESIAFEKITQPNFNVTQLAHEIAIGERQLNRKLKKLTGLTPGNYLKEIRLQKARQLLENKAFSTVSEISFAIGFNTAEYFSRVYKKRFGKLPSEYFK